MQCFSTKDSATRSSVSPFILEEDLFWTDWWKDCTAHIFFCQRSWLRTLTAQNYKLINITGRLQDPYSQLCSSGSSNTIQHRWNWHPVTGLIMTMQISCFWGQNTRTFSISQLEMKKCLRLEVKRKKNSSFFFFLNIWDKMNWMTQTFHIVRLTDNKDGWCSNKEEWLRQSDLLYCFISHGS